MALGRTAGDWCSATVWECNVDGGGGVVDKPEAPVEVVAASEASSGRMATLALALTL